MSTNEGLLVGSVAGIDAEAIEAVAKREGVSPSFLRKQVAVGRAVLMVREGKPPLGIGEGLRTKVNANIGTSADLADPEMEVEKAKTAERYGADTITDLSMGGPIDYILGRIKEAISSPLTTVPIYQTVAEKGSFEAVTEGDLFRTIRKHLQAGVSSVVLHAAITLDMLEELKRTERIMGVVSKGGSFTSAWMLEKGEENPFLTHFDDISHISHL